MNLLNKYIPTYSGHVKSIMYDKQNRMVEIVFFDRPDTFIPRLKLVFEGISNFREEHFDEHDENDIELVIGLDFLHGNYCLHTNVREINFNTTNVVSFILNKEHCSDKKLSSDELLVRCK